MKFERRLYFEEGNDGKEWRKASVGGGKRSFANTNRSRAQGCGGNYQRIAETAGGHVRALSEDEEFSLAHERETFSRLPFAAGRAWRPDFRHDGRYRGTGTQDWRNDDSFHQRDLKIPTVEGQQRRICGSARHADGAIRGQSGADEVFPRGA